jgi:hypothetical protein
MGKINIGRVIISGIIIGVIVDVIEGIMNGWLLSAQWTAAMAAMNQPPIGVGQVIGFNIYGLIIGLGAAWIYAGFRPRFGAGHRTALIAGLTVWVLAYFIPYFSFALTGLPIKLMVTIGIVGLVEIIVATLVGAYFYQEDA